MRGEYVHLYSRPELALYLANGVTTEIDPAYANAEAARKFVEEHKR